MTHQPFANLFEYYEGNTSIEFFQKRDVWDHGFHLEHWHQAHCTVSAFTPADTTIHIPSWLYYQQIQLTSILSARIGC